MLLYVFIIATVNLGVGYAMGAGLSLGSLFDMLPERKKKEAVGADNEDDQPLSRPVSVTPVVAEEAPPPPPRKPKPADAMASLTMFREKLTAANVELKLNRQDPNKFEASATKLQAVNHTYLEEAEETIKHLEEMGAAGDKVASETCAAVSSGASEVAAISDAIDGLIKKGLSSDEARNELIGKNQQARDAASKAEEQTIKTVNAAKPKTRSAPAAGSDLPEAEEAKPSSFGVIDALFDSVEALMKDAEKDEVKHVAAIRVDPIPEADGNDALVEAVERAVAKAATEILAETQPLVPGRPAMVLLEGDSFDEASQRVEQLRQQIEATHYSFGGEEYRATVTCALIDAHAGDTRARLIDQLNQTLDESIQQGANRTFHHDGAFPTALPEMTLHVETKSVELD